jgi:hypothetical protein
VNEEVNDEVNEDVNREIRMNVNEKGKDRMNFVLHGFNKIL